MIAADRRRLAAGVAVSGALHAGAVAALGLSPPLWRQPPAPRDAQPPRIRPGIEHSQTATINWLGFETPTPHQAPQSQIDQPLLALEPGLRQTAPSPRTAPEANPAASPPRSDSPAREPDSASTPIIAPTASAPLLIPQSAFVGPPAPPARAEANASPARAAPRETAPESSASAEPESPPQPAGEPATDRGKDAEASSREKPIAVVLGRPVAAEGVDITTVRPRWTLYTRMTASPRNPLIEAQFDRAGRVATARMIESSGRADVDGPLLDAIYNWRAKGAAIDALSAENAQSTRLTLRFRIGLR